MSVTFLNDVGTAQLIEQSEENFNNAGAIIEAAFKDDVLAIQQVENYLNEKSVFLDARQDSVHWEQDQAHDQKRFHFVLTDKRDGRDSWLASDARYVRSRLAELVKNLGEQIQGLKTAC